MCGAQTLVIPPRGQREQRPLGRQGQNRSSDRSAERQAGSEGAAQCFVLITSEMLTWASLGTVRGRPAPRAVEALLQTVRKTQVSSGGGERASGLGGSTFIMPGGQRGSPEMALPHSLLAGCSLPSAWAWPLTPLGPQDSMAGLAGALLGAAVQLEVVATAKLPVHPFRGCPGRPSAGWETARHTYFKHQCNGLWPIEG